MAELVPIPFKTLLRRMYYEYTKAQTIFDLPLRKFYAPTADENLAVTSCGNPAANPVGPAAGPHTQLTQNIALAWLAGSRIIELKTVQIKDQLDITRPCIDMATIGYNTEWSQELRLDESAKEYVKAVMTVEILKHWLFLDAPGSQYRSSQFNTIFDVSVGYDLAGIQSPQIRSWLNGMKDASVLIEEFRNEIPDEFKQYRDLPFQKKISDSITLSTFHGTPADEIERICEFLLGEMGFHVVIKMNPPMLGRARLEHLLHEKLGYTNVSVNPKAYELNIPFKDAVAVVKRLENIGKKNGKTVGVKFGNTLEVLNQGKFLKDKVQYLSGQPLHILHLSLVNDWRKEFGADFPISFSAGVDANNFADCVSIGLVPVTACSDLLRPGGYGRLPNYLTNLEKSMKSLGAKSVDEFIVLTAKQSGCSEVTRPSSVLHNTERLLEKSISNPRYHFSANNKLPKKIGSSLHLFDCINCDKCIPVCPNDANFYFEIDPIEIVYANVEITAQGWKKITGGSLAIKEKHQIGNYADACNECGNCDVFCPEDGGPYIEKPRFFGSPEAYKKWNTLSGFVLQSDKNRVTLFGRFKDQEYELHRDKKGSNTVFKNHSVQVTLKSETNEVVDASGAANAVMDLRYYFVMNALLKGILNTDRVHFVNAGIVS
ncbi:4Fe-4S dicluster domain-containing protein [bacterium]|nr:4Fe-4S dicluster domain-containing protein [bacterium]